MLIRYEIHDTWHDKKITVEDVEAEELEGEEKSRNRRNICQVAWYYNKGTFNPFEVKRIPI